MSLVNGVSHLCSSDYPAIYMVSSTVMKEAEDIGGTFYGVVGQVEPAHPADNDTGYGSGFDSNWKGLTPGVLRRTALSIFNSAKSRKKQVRDFIVFEKSLAKRTQSEEGNTQTIATTDYNGWIPMSNDTGLPVLLVEQSSDVRGESYLVRAVRRSENAIESTAFRLPKVSLKWIRFGFVGIIILFYITMLNVIVHPMKTYRSIRERARLHKHQVQIFLSGVRTVANDTASITAIKGSLKTRLQALLSAPSADDIELSERLREDNLPRISFKACERFQRRGDAASTSPIGTNKTEIPGFIAQAFLATIISSLSFLILGLMSNFNHGSSSKTERVVLMMWLAIGIVVGLLVPFLNINDAFTLLVRIPLEVQAAARTQVVVMTTAIFPNAHYITALIMLLVCLPWSVFVVPIWGFIIVGQQLAEWGTCVSIY